MMTMGAAPAILLMGPTASGKTALAMELTRRFPAELVSVDSAQVFRDMDIGTAKPDAATLRAYPHHLIDLISPEEAYSAARFRADALAVMDEITARGKLPIIVGGTGLYIKALLEDYKFSSKGEDSALRTELDEAATDTARAQAKSRLLVSAGVLGLLQQAPSVAMEALAPSDWAWTVNANRVRELLDERQLARERRDFARADALRGELEAAGFIVEDTLKGMVVRPKGKELA